jgi:hypothetical protein
MCNNSVLEVMLRNGVNMARISDTRARVRAIAEELTAADKPVSARQVLALLGKGSLSTITDELRIWENSRLSAEKLRPLGGPVQPPVPAHHEASAPMEVPPAPHQFSVVGGPAGEILGILRGIAETMSGLQLELALVREEFATSEKTHQAQLAKAYERYESVQRHVMVQLDETRQVAANLRQKLQTTEMDAQLREDAQRGKAQSLRDENARLIARLEILGVTVQGRG